MNTPEERNANHSDVDAQSASSVDTGTPEVPEEITEARDLLTTAQANTDLAEAAEVSALAEYRQAQRSYDARVETTRMAHQDERDAHDRYIAALRRHGYVQTADGPKPRA